MNHILPFSFRVISSLVVLLVICNHPNAQIRYVNFNAIGSADGLSWTNAYTDLQPAIDASGSGDTIMVAQGTYHPTFRYLGDSARHSTFYISKTIHLLGGFSGAPGTEGSLAERNILTQPTILSGDIGIPDEPSDNVFHVLYLEQLSDSTWIDGFTITKGNGFGGAGYEALGTGIFNNGNGGFSSPVIANCIISENRTNESGGGMTNQAEMGGIASPTLINCSFINNRGSGGGGLNSYTDAEGEASPVLIGCKFLGNEGPTAGGGAIQIISHSATSSPRLINCIVTGNHSPTSSALASFVTGTTISNIEIINSAFSGNTGGSIRAVDIGSATSTLTIRNSIIWGNGGAQAPNGNGYTIDAAFSIIPFGFPGEGVIGLDPMFVSQPPLLDTNHILGDLHLLPGSPAFDAGNNTAVPAGINTDHDHLPRFVNSITGQAGTVDIGPYEFQGDITSISEQIGDDQWSVNPNPAIENMIVKLSGKGDKGFIQIINHQGVILTTKSIQSNQTVYNFDVSNLQGGMYFIYVNEDGRSGVKKVLVQKP